MLFTNKDLRKLLVPLIIERMLSILVGMIDVVMVGAVGEAAMSGVSLVDSINMLLIQLMGALATGGAVVAGQALGAGKKEKASRAGNQLLLVTTLIATAIMIFCLAGNYGILHLLFPKISQDVLQNARTYFFVTSLSFPFLAIYNSCAALYRTMGNSKISMETSLVMNGVNVIGNAIGVYLLKAGVLGVAIPTLFARILAAGIMLYIIRNEKNVIQIDPHLRLGFEPGTIVSILRIGIPAGMENGMFQFGKIMLQSIVSGMGTAVIAGFAAASSIVTWQYTTGMSIGLGMITVVSQCIGAKEYEQAKMNVKKMVILNFLILMVICPLMILFRGSIVSWFSLVGPSAEYAKTLVLYHSLIMLIWPVAFCMPNAFRAAGDVTFTMLISVSSMWVFRIGLSYIFVNYFGFHVVSVWIAMSIDWVFRYVIFLWRIMSGKWLSKVDESL